MHLFWGGFVILFISLAGGITYGMFTGATTGLNITFLFPPNIQPYQLVFVVLGAVFVLVDWPKHGYR